MALLVFQASVISSDDVLYSRHGFGRQTWLRILAPVPGITDNLFSLS